MSKRPLTISEEASVQMPMKTVASLIGMVAIGTWAYFGIIETQNSHHTRLQLMEADLEKNTEFRIKWPRGLMVDNLVQRMGEIKMNYYFTGALIIMLVVLALCGGPSV